LSSASSPTGRLAPGRGKSDPIDAHLAVLAALRLDADRLPTPRADGDREALRILLGARQELTVVTTSQLNRLRALLLGGDDTERDLARATLTDPILVAMARRRPSPQTSREQAIRHSEIRRLARAVRAGRRALIANRAQLQTIVEEMAARLTERRGIGAVTAAQVIVSFSHPGRCRSDAAFPVGHQPVAGQQWPDGPASAQPRRRPGPEQGDPHHHPHPHAVLSDN
jgi:transposase